jgi:hypothetical protein
METMVVFGRTSLRLLAPRRAPVSPYRGQSGLSRIARAIATAAVGNSLLHGLVYANDPAEPAA